MTLDRIRRSACVAPIFYVSDIQRSLHFYTEVLGFEKQWDWGDPVDFACVAFGEVELFLCQEGQGHPGTWLYLFIDEVETYASWIRDRGVEILAGPQDEPWGMREMVVKDPDGHVLRIGTALERCGSNGIEPEGDRP